MIKQNADGSITIAGKTIQKATVDAALEYYKAKTRKETPEGKYTFRFQALHKHLMPIKGGLEQFEEWALAQIERENNGRRNALSVMETFLVQYGYEFDIINGQSYSKNLELFLTQILAPQLCAKAKVAMPNPFGFKDVTGMGDPKIWGTEGDEHVEAYGYCSLNDMGNPAAGTTVYMSRHTLHYGEAAESVMRHELAHHLEWTKHKCWGDTIFDPESGQLVPLSKEWTRGYKDGHGRVFYMCARKLGLNLKGFHLTPEISNTAWYANTFTSKKITLTTKGGNTFSYDRAEFYRKK